MVVVMVGVVVVVVAVATEIFMLLFKTHRLHNPPLS